MKRSRIFLATLLMIGAAGAQQSGTFPNTPPSSTMSSAASDTVLKIDVNLVQLDAVVTDSKGNPVGDLKAEDFEALQDGKAQTITHFTYVKTVAATANAGPEAAGTAQGATIPRREDVRRTIAIVVDDLGLSFESTVRVRAAVKKFVAEKVQPGDLVAILCTGRGSGVFQQFTTDKKLLSAAADAIRFNMTNRVGLYAIPATMLRSREPRVFEGRPEEDSLDEFRQEYFTVGTLGSLQWVIRGLRDMPGRKSIVLFSENMAMFEAVDARVNTLVQRVVDSANRSSVVFYVIDPRGLLYLGPTASDGAAPDTSGATSALWASQEGLSVLAAETGGLFVRNDNDINDAIGRVMNDQAGYYLIGYKPKAETFTAGKYGPQFHTFKIRLKTKRRGLKIRSRAGFYGVTDEKVRSADNAPEQRLAGALMSPFGETGIHLRLTPVFAHTVQYGSYVKTLLHVDARDLKFTDEAAGTHKGKIEVVIATFDADGIPVDLTMKPLALGLSDAEYKTCLERGALFTLTHRVKRPGAYQFRAAVRDVTSGKMGSANQFIEIPNLKKKRIVLSGIVVGERTAQAAPKMTVGDVEIPTDGWPLRVFHRGSDLAYAYEVLNARRDEKSKSPEIEVQMKLLRDGKEVFASEPRKAGVSNTTGGPPYFAVEGAFHLGTKMEPGSYVLQVIASDDLAPRRHRSASQWIDFEVRQ
jgi:VWFA-related protein